MGCNDTFYFLNHKLIMTLSEERRRDELIRIIEGSVEQLSLPLLEAVYYDLISKGDIDIWLLLNCLAF